MASVAKDMRTTADASGARAGVPYALGAYLIWGLVPLYFKSVAHVAPAEVLAHRVVWSVVLLVLLLVVLRRIGVVGAVLRSRRTLVTLLVTTVLIGTNWFVFIWSVTNNQLLQCGLGYYMNPLVTVFLGFVFLGERLRPLQVLSVVLAGVGVAYMTIDLGELPLVALVLACSFAVYGLLRKTARVDALTGLTVETALLTPAAVGYVVYLAVVREVSFGSGSLGNDLLLMSAGVVTSVPLLLFAVAARRLRLVTLGFLQYISPTGHFLLAVLAFGEPFTRTHMISFGFIWAALTLYSVEAARARTRLRRTTGE